MAARISIIIGFCGFLAACSAQMELDERFLEYRKHGLWLVEFYAPWCGHCKKLEPIYREVANELQQMGSDIKTAKLDCTRYSEVASEFSVRGFPTIMFISGDRVYTHRGDRSKEEIIEFALKAKGPTVRKISSIGKFNEALSRHSDNVFFLFIGNDDEQDDLFRKYSSSADIHAISSYFYYGKRNVIESRPIQRHPTVLVFKDHQYFEYQPPQGIVTASSLEAWVNRQRYSAFPKTSGPGLNEMSSAAEFLVILAAESVELHDPASRSARLYSVVKEVAFGQKDKFHSQFQFVWMDELETVSSIAMAFLASPSLMVLRTTDHLYYLPHVTEVGSGGGDITVPELAAFLARVAQGQEPAYGGTSFFMRVRRLLFDIVSTILSIWQASRWLFLLMFGLPTVIISIICYSLCCMETIDDGQYDSEEEEEEEEGEGQGQLYDGPPPPPALSHSNPPPTYESLSGGETGVKDDSEKKNE